MPTCGVGSECCEILFQVTNWFVCYSRYTFFTSVCQKYSVTQKLSYPGVKEEKWCRRWLHVCEICQHCITLIHGGSGRVNMA